MTASTAGSGQGVRTFAELEPHLDHLRAAPREVGTLELLVRRPAGVASREVLLEGRVDEGVGLVGDTWSVRASRSTPDGSPDPLKQVTLMSHRMVALLADDPAGQAMAGDQLYVDLDLSVANLPAGTLLGIGTAVVEVTAPPHRGCPKFVRYFGQEAMQFVNSPVGRELRLRGANARVVRGGDVRVGDRVTKQAVTLF